MQRLQLLAPLLFTSGFCRLLGLVLGFCMLELRRNGGVNARDLVGRCSTGSPSLNQFMLHGLLLVLQGNQLGFCSFTALPFTFQFAPQLLKRGLGVVQQRQQLGLKLLGDRR